MNNASRIQNPILEGLDTAVAVFDSNMRLEFANTAFSDLWDLDKNWLESQPNLEELLERLRSSRSLPEVSDFGLFKKQEFEKFSSLSNVQKDMMFLPDGRTLQRQIKPNGEGGVVYSFQDISEFLRLQRSVKEMGAVQRATLDNLNEGVAVFGSDGKLKLYNPKFLNLWSLDGKVVSLNLHLSEVLELMRPLIEQNGMNEDSIVSEWDTYKSVAVANILSRNQNKERIMLKDGTVMDYINVPLPDGAVLLTYVDVTDSEKIANALSERAQALEDANHMKSEFIANVSREIRSPLNTIASYAEMLKEEYFGKLNLRQEEYIAGIFSNSKGLISVVNDILELSMIDAGQMELKIEPIDIHQLLASSLKLITNQAKQKQLKIEFECSTDIGLMMGDVDCLKQIFFKLLSNSVNYNNVRGGITLRATREKGAIVVSVGDTGIGIPRGEKTKIFEPFYHLKSNKKIEENSLEGCGVGLGLTIVRQFVERHNGNLEVRSLVGRGTTVTCRFPAES